MAREHQRRRDRRHQPGQLIKLSTAETTTKPLRTSPRRVSGPVGFQCYAIRGDSKTNLQRSINGENSLMLVQLNSALIAAPGLILKPVFMQLTDMKWPEVKALSPDTPVVFP